MSASCSSFSFGVKLVKTPMHALTFAFFPICMSDAESPTITVSFGLELVSFNPTVIIQDGKRLQKIGIEKWIKEQERRVKRGFVYADIRYPWQT